MKQIKTLFFYAIIITTTFTNCTSNEIANSSDVNQDKIYQSYVATYKEGMPNAEVTGTFRFGGSNGTTLVLSNPSNVNFDGHITKVDSSWGGGAFYKTQIPSTKWIGLHEINFTTINNKVYTNTFTNNQFAIKNLPESISKKDSLVINFIAPTLQANDFIEVRSLNTDSSFRYISSSSNGNNYNLTILGKDIAKQKNNKLEFEAILYMEKKLTSTTSEGGAITIKHALKDMLVRLSEIKN